MFDPDIVTIHEHIHASMLARELGFETWFEPESRVTYLAFAPWRVGELGDLRRRWDFDQADRSLAGFARRWNVIDDADYRGPTHQFLNIHAGHTDLIDPRPQTAANRERPMERSDLQQTLAGLQWQALETGYSQHDVRKLTNAYRIAAGLLDGLYRPCGRPFINHLTGTASVLVFYGCAMPQVMAGMLHAFLSHGPRPLADRLLNQLAGMNTVADGAAKLVKSYEERGKLLDSLDLAGDKLGELPVDTASLFLIDAANEVDMELSFEVAMTGRTDTLPDSRMAILDRLLPTIGVPGLAETLHRLRGTKAPWPGVAFHPDLKASVRFKDTRGSGGVAPASRFQARAPLAPAAQS
jgi:hypothetical protein